MSLRRHRRDSKDKSDRPAHHSGSGFVNPWSVAICKGSALIRRRPSAKSTWTQLLTTFPFQARGHARAHALTLRQYKEELHPSAVAPKVVPPRFDEVLSDTTRTHATWLGHAGFLVRA